MRTHLLPVLTAALLLPAAAVTAQSADSDSKARSKADRVEIERRPGRGVRVFMNGDDASSRAMIGVGTASSGRRDTLGLLVTSVTPNGPAEKAGIVEGNRIAAINGVNLRLAAADAGEDDMDGIAARRLTRELGKVTPGAEVELRVYADGQWKTVRVKTVPRDSLVQTRYFRSSDMDERAVLGFQLDATGSKRDTIGVFVGSILDGGPADKAGIVEGDRVVSVNGTDLRVSRDDIGDSWVSSTMVNRFQRVMRGVKPGDKVQLRVWSGGQVKNVTVTAAKASDVYKSEGREGRRFRFFGPDVFGFEGGPTIAPVPPLPPMPTMPTIAPRVRINSMDMDDEDDVIDDSEDAAVDAAQRALSDSLLDVLKSLRASMRTRPIISNTATFATTAPVATAVWSSDNVANAWTGATTGRISVPGLSLAPVTPELAEYLGKGSENGYLVLDATGPWTRLHVGDVIIGVDGTAVRDTNLPALDGHDVQVIRKGRKTSLRM